jgi:hypothetical protein
MSAESAEDDDAWTPPVIYAVVPTKGLYGQGDTVGPIATRSDLFVAQRKARIATKQHQDAVRSVGGLSEDGYRVISLADGDPHSWLGHELDLIPTVENSP